MPVLMRMAPVAVVAGDHIRRHGGSFLFEAGYAQHLIFSYLLPTAFVAMIYGSVLSMLCAVAATLIAAFFLYAPIYSLYVSGPREFGELILFAVIGLLGAKCIAELRRPPEKIAKPETELGSK
jgi:K+-sensing histidine kinase KdpD